MKINSAKSFREWFKKQNKYIDNEEVQYEPDFIGEDFVHSDGEHISRGVFAMYHGHKKNIKGHLATYVNMAGTEQAVNEFIQNAADCESTHFYTFATEKYFLAINNGTPFTVPEVDSLLNIAQSTKKSASKIGRMGIGFKLIHQLVGETNGLKEMLEDYAGPILFSWSKPAQLEAMLEGDKVECSTELNQVNALPFWFKICATNFPTDPEEKVLDFEHNERVMFTADEKSEMCKFARVNMRSLPYKTVMKHGTMIFIKLGKGKGEILQKGVEDICSGIRYSMNTLKQLQEICLNGERLKKVPLELMEGKIEKGCESFVRIAPEYDDYDIQFQVGYKELDFKKPASVKAVDELKNAPSFYKFFPMGDEMHSQSLFVHSDAFKVEPNRRRLIQEKGNYELLNQIVIFLKSKLEFFRITDRARFLQLYANILLNDIPHGNSAWLKERYYDPLMDCIRTFIPTESGFVEDPKNVKICKVSFPIELKALGINEYDWFAYDMEALCSNARNKAKLGLEDWTILDVLQNADARALHEWISSLNSKLYVKFIEEIDSALKSYHGNKEWMQSLPIFKLSDGRFYSYESIVDATDDENVMYYGRGVFLNKESIDIEEPLRQFGLFTSAINLDDYPNLKKAFSFPTRDSFRKTLEKSHKFYTSVLNKYKKTDYDQFKELISKLFNYIVPNSEYRTKLDAHIGLIGGNSNLVGLIPTTQDLTQLEVNILIDFCHRNDEDFFEGFFIFEGSASGMYCIGTKTANHGQYYGKKKSELIERLYPDYFALPDAFVSEENLKSKNILKDEDLIDRVLHSKDFESKALLMADCIDTAHRSKYLSKITGLKINLDYFQPQDKQACQVLKLAGDEFFYSNYGSEEFRKKVTIQSRGIKYNLFEDIKGDSEYVNLGRDYSIRELLPDRKQSDVILRLVDRCKTSVNMEECKLIRLLGTTHKTNADDVYQMMCQGDLVLKNTQQWSFVSRYTACHPDAVNHFEILNDKGTPIMLRNESFYRERISYINPDYVISDIYKDLDDYIIPHLLSEPYISNDKLIFPHIKGNLLPQEKEDVIVMLYNKWQEDPVQFKSVAWNYYLNHELKDVLKIKYGISVYPCDYASSEEKLPDSLESWLDQGVINLEFIKIFGVQLDDSPIVRLRKYISNESEEQSDLNSFECEDLKRTFDWMRENSVDILPYDEPRFRFVKKMSERIFSSDGESKYSITDDFDGNQLDKEAKSIEQEPFKSFSTETHWQFFQCDDSLLKRAFMVGWPDFTLYWFRVDECLCKCNCIYFPQNADIKASLLVLANDENCKFSREDYNQLFVKSLDVILQENERLKRELSEAKRRIQILEMELYMAKK